MKPLPDLEIGQHVLFVEGDKVKDALILVKFSERSWPSLTLIVVRPRSHGDGLVIKSAIPHESRRQSGRSYWALPPQIMKENYHEEIHADPADARAAGAS